MHVFMGIIEHHNKEKSYESRVRRLEPEFYLKKHVLDVDSVISEVREELSEMQQEFRELEMRITSGRAFLQDLIAHKEKQNGAS